MLPGGQYALFEGNLDDYPRMAQVSGFPNILDPSYTAGQLSGSQTSGVEKENRHQQRADAQNVKRERQKLQRRIDDLERLMSELTGKLSALEIELNDAGSEYQKAQELAARQVELQEKLSQVEADWMSCSESIEQLSIDSGRT